MMVNSCALSNNAVCVNELPRHLDVPAGLVNERQIEGDLPPQVHLIIRYALSERRASSVPDHPSMCVLHVHQTYLQTVYRQGKRRLVIMDGQMCEAQLVDCSA